MGRGTLVFLLLLVGVLGWFTLERRREAARGGPAVEEFALAPGLVAERARAVRIEHLERGLSIKLERDAQGRWYLTDPVEYPAQGGLVRALLRMLVDARGEPLDGVDPQELGLAPPRVVVEVVSVEESGEHTLRLELGGLDFDPARILVRASGHPHALAGGSDVFATTRALFNTLERNPDDYRDNKATGLSPQEVVSVRRAGQVFLGEAGGVVALEFEAVQGPEGWKTARSPAVTLSPEALALLSRGATDLVIDRFVDDAPRDLARYGLDAPAFTLELETSDGRRTRLAFGHTAEFDGRDVGETVWYCQRDDYPHVWEVRTRDVELLTRPGSLFYEQSVLRAIREEVKRLDLAADGLRRVLEREGSGWTVRAVQEPERGDEARYPAETSEVEAALAVLERAQVAEHLAETFEPVEPELSFRVRLANGQRQGGRLGRPTRDPTSGAEGVQYLRDGDELLGVIGADVAELCRRPVDSFRSRRVHQVLEAEVRLIELTRAGKTFAFRNDGDNRWTTHKTTLPAPEGFTLSLDSLLNLGARRWLEPGEAGEGETVLEVGIGRSGLEPLRFSFVRLADERVLCVRASGERAEVDPKLVERLTGLF